MINRLLVENFKCFTKLELEMSNLNVLSGINGMGKSTMIQALLLLRQSYESGVLRKGLYLNGSLVNIGTGKDLICRYGDIDEIKIGIISENNKYKWEYEYKESSDYLKLLKNLSEDGIVKVEDNILFSNNFEYISAERLGPRRNYKTSYFDVYDKNQIGLQGEMSVYYLAEKGRDKLENELVLHESEKNNLLELQVNAWLSEISPGVKVEVKNYRDARLVGLNYAMKGKSGIDEYSAVNVGFGISYILPIVITLLKAKKGDFIILENPEAHLHPRGQRKIGELISKAAAGGVQIVVETHSDHLLNGLRIAVKNGIISNDKIKLNYFYVIEDSDGKVITHDKTTPIIMEDGSLSDWPIGFFDEWDIAIDELF
ncbi:MAG: DUF3696 domain-containing protein [Lachnotalea sp.]